MSGTCVYAGLPLVPVEFQLFGESSSALRVSHTLGSLHRLQELFRELLHLLHGRLAGSFSLIVVLYRAHSLPPFGWMVQPSERISIDWLEGGNLAICLFLESSVMPKSSYFSCGSERYVENVVHTPFAGFAHCVALSLLLQRDLPSANETWRQFTPEIQCSGCSLVG